MSSCQGTLLCVCPVPRSDTGHGAALPLLLELAGLQSPVPEVFFRGATAGEGQFSDTVAIGWYAWEIQMENFFHLILSEPLQAALLKCFVLM